MSNFVSYHSLSPSFRSLSSFLDSVSIPHSVQETLSQSNWRVIMEEEMRALEKNRT